MTCVTNDQVEQWGQASLHKIHPLLLVFTLSREENDFRNKVVRASIFDIRAALAVGIIIIFCFIPIDLTVFENEQTRVRAIQLRSFIMIPCALGIFASTFLAHYVKWSQIIGSVTYFVFGVTWTLLCFKTEPIAIPYACGALVQTYIYAYFAIGLLFYWSFIISCLVTTIFSISIWTAGLPVPLALLSQISLICICMFLSIAAYQKEKMSRLLYVKDLREKEHILRKNQEDETYLQWLRQLAAFLRHEVRQPVAQINSSIEVLKIELANNASARPYISGASQGALDIWNLIERACRATDAAAFVADSHASVTNIDEVVHAVVKAFRQSNSDLNFELTSCGLCCIKLDPALIKEALINLLSNAVSYSDEKATIKITTALLQNQYVISVQNQGETIKSHPSLLFQPFVSLRPKVTEEHHGIGLYLVKLIAEHYSGTASIANIEDGSGVEARIKLPLSI